MSSFVFVLFKFVLATYLNVDTWISTRILVSKEIFDKINSWRYNRYLIKCTIWIKHKHNRHQIVMEGKVEISIKLSSSILVVILSIAEIIYIAKPKHRKRIYEINLASLSVADCLFSLSFTIISSIFLLKLSEKKLLETT